MKRLRAWPPMEKVGSAGHPMSSGPLLSAKRRIPPLFGVPAAGAAEEAGADGLGAADDAGIDGLGAAEVEAVGLGAAAEEAGAGALEAGALEEGVGEAVEQDMTNSEARITSIRIK